jgi:hypothetical protein
MLSARRSAVTTMADKAVESSADVSAAAAGSDDRPANTAATAAPATIRISLFSRTYVGLATSIVIILIFDQIFDVRSR